MLINDRLSTFLTQHAGERAFVQRSHFNLLVWRTILDGWPQEKHERLWFAGNAADDRDLQTRFGGMIDRALAGDLEHWTHSPTDLLAYILLLDQMTRAVNRGTAAAFAGDALALTACKKGLAVAFDRELAAAQRMFFYLPLEHSENHSDQKRSVTLYTALRKQFPAHQNKLEGAFQYAVKHHDLIYRFGRFPHRNVLLGRTSSADERNYLQNTNERFGQKNSE